MSLLEVQNLRAGYGPLQVLHGIDFSVDEGQVCVILGANGSGKSTTLKALSGLIRGSGRAELAGNSLLKGRPDQVAGFGVSLVPEGRGTFKDLSVKDNLMLGAIKRKDKEVKADLELWTTTFGRLGERISQTAGSLSGGEQQMLAIARAMMARPRLLLLDEPSQGLAPIITQGLFAQLRSFNTDFGLTMLVVEQNAQLALGIAHHAYVLEAGEIVVDGPAAQLADDPALAKAYLGM